MHFKMILLSWVIKKLLNTNDTNLLKLARLFLRNETLTRFKMEHKKAEMQKWINYLSRVVIDILDMFLSKDQLKHLINGTK